MIYKAPEPIASRTMKILWIGLLVLLPVAAQAGSPEQDYLAARDAHIRKLAVFSKPGADMERSIKPHEAAVADLEKHMKRVVGTAAPAVPGIAPRPKLNNDTLLKGDQGFGMLDGLIYLSEDYKTRVVVTTESLFKIWLRVHRKWWRDNNVPEDPAKALAHVSFYTQAVDSGSALSKYAELPIKKPAAASIAYAMLGGWAQDDGPWEPGELVISVMQGGKLYVVRVPAGTKIGPFPPCQAVWDEAERKSNEAFQRAQDKPNAKAADGGKVREDGATAFRRCFAERVPKEKGFADLVRQAQSIADALPAK
jgi:hypothetical protein